MTDKNIALREHAGTQIEVTPNGRFVCDELTTSYGSIDALIGAIDRKRASEKRVKRIKVAIDVWAIVRLRVYGNGTPYMLISLTYTGVHAGTGKATFKQGPRAYKNPDAICYVLPASEQAKATELLEVLVHIDQLAKKERELAKAGTTLRDMNCRSYGKPRADELERQLAHTLAQLTGKQPEGLVV